jgi:DNA-binding winged helix-turn-helix (wHTH) protein/tetratricopeptide (TPR) repeat protein
MDRPAAWRTIAVDLEAERPFRVGNATVDPLSREAEFPGGRERIQPQHLKVLIALVRQTGDVVTRSTLIDSCWGGRIVGEDVINRSISILRDFAERAGGFSIETVPKAGYRLLEEGAKGSSARHPLRWTLFAALLIAIAVGFWLAPRLLGGPDSRPPLVALKPLTSSGDPGTRELAAATGDALSHMMVAASFHGKLAWPATAKDEAKADLVLSGDVRRNGNTYSALMQLRDRRTGTLLLSQLYETPVADVGPLPEQIGAQITSNLTGVLALMVLDRSHSRSPELAAEKLKTIAVTVTDDDPLISYKISNRIGASHPDWLLAQLGVAYDTAFALSSLPKAERQEAVQKARVAADRALRMAPDFGDTYAPWCLLHPSTYSRECEDRLRAGMEADPDAPFTPVFLSSLLYKVGRFEESSQFARTGLAGDPFHPHKLRRVIRTSILLGEKEEAEQLFAQAVRWWPKHPGLHWDRLFAYALTGDFDDAEKAIGQLPQGVLDRARSQIAAMLSAFKARDLVRLRAVCLDPKADFLARNYCLTALHRLNDHDSALQVADHLFPRVVGATPKEDEAIWLDDPFGGLEPMLSAPTAAWLRLDPKFLVFAERTGAIRYWRADRLPDFCRKRPEPICSTLIKLGRRS